MPVKESSGDALFKLLLAAIIAAIVFMFVWFRKDLWYLFTEAWR